MGNLGIKRVKQGCAALALLFAVMFYAAGCGKADKAYGKAMKLAEEGNYAKAAKSFEEAIQKNGEKAEYYIGYGMTLNFLGDYNKAVKQFEKAYQEMDNKISRRNNKQLYYGEALAYYGMHNYEKALECCQNSLEIKGQPEIDRSVYSTMAVLYWSSGDSVEAVESLDKLLKSDKKDVDGYLLRGQLYMNMGDPETALNDFSQALQLDKNCYDAYFGLYDAYEASGQVDAARESLEMLTGIRAKDAEQKMQVGRAYQQLGEEAQAVSYLEDAQKQGSVEADYYLGMVQMAKQDYDAAIHYFEKYIENVAVIGIPEVYNQMAGALIATEEWDRAEDYLSEGLALGMGSAYRNLLKNQVILLEKQQKFQEAAKAAKTYLESYPADEAMTKELAFIRTRITKNGDQKADAQGGEDGKQDGQPTAEPNQNPSDSPSATPGQTAKQQSSATPDRASAEPTAGTVTKNPGQATDAPTSEDTVQGQSPAGPEDGQGSRYSVR